MTESSMRGQLLLNLLLLGLLISSMGGQAVDRNSLFVGYTELVHTNVAGSKGDQCSRAFKARHSLKLPSSDLGRHAGGGVVLSTAIGKVPSPSHHD